MEYNIREEQDIEFQEALLQQQQFELEEKKKKEEEEKKKKEQEKSIKKLQREIRKRKKEEKEFLKLKSIKQEYFEKHEEPIKNKETNPYIYTIKIKNNNTFYQRNFHKTDKISLIIDFLISKGLHPKQISLETTYPKIQLNELDKTLEDYNINCSTVLYNI